MHGDMSEFAHRQERFRAMMIGLALGDATLAPDGETFIAGAATDLAMRQLHAVIRAWRPPDSRAESTLIQATIDDLQSFVYNTDEPTSVQLEPRPWFGQPAVPQAAGQPASHGGGRERRSEVLRWHVQGRPRVAASSAALCSRAHLDGR